MTSTLVMSTKISSARMSHGLVSLYKRDSTRLRYLDAKLDEINLTSRRRI